MVNYTYNLPYPFFQQEYIILQNNAFIKLNFNSSSTYCVDCDIEVASALSNYWFGQQQYNGNMMYNGLYNTGALEYNWKTITHTAANRIIMTQRRENPEYSGQYKQIIWINNQKFRVEVGTNGYSDYFYIGACNGGARPYGANMTIRYFCIHSVGNTSLGKYIELIPCKNNLTNEYGLYDVIGGTFYTNANISSDGATITGSITGAEGVCTQHKFLYKDETLPSSFTNTITPVQYVQFSGSQYIDTGVQINMNTDAWEIKAQATSTSQNGFLMGDWTTSNNYWWLYHYNAGSVIRLYLTNSSYSQTYLATPFTSAEVAPHTYKYRGKALYVDGKLASSSYSTTYSVGTGNTYIGAASGTNGLNYKYSGRVYYIKLWKNGSLVRHFIPAKKSIRGIVTVGMYDLINKIFYAPTSGTLTAGANGSTDLSKKVYSLIYNGNDCHTLQYTNSSVTNDIAWTKHSLLSFVPKLRTSGSYVYIDNWAELKNILTKEGKTYSDLSIGMVIKRHKRYTSDEKRYFDPFTGYVLNEYERGDGSKGFTIVWDKQNYGGTTFYSFTLNSNGRISTGFLNVVKRTFNKIKSTQRGSHYRKKQDGTKFFYKYSYVGLVLRYKTESHYCHTPLSSNWYRTSDNGSGTCQYSLETAPVVWPIPE